MPGQSPVLFRPARDCHDLLPTHSTNGYATVCHAASFMLLRQVLRAAAVRATCIRMCLRSNSSRKHAFGLKHLCLCTISMLSTASDAFLGSLANRSLRGAQQHTACVQCGLSKCHHVLQVSTAQSSGTTLLCAAFMLRNMTWH